MEEKKQYCSNIHHYYNWTCHDDICTDSPFPPPFPFSLLPFFPPSRGVCSYDKLTKHVVGTARFTVNYAIAVNISRSASASAAPPAALEKERHTHAALCTRGVAFLHEHHTDQEHGGLSWVLQGQFFYIKTQ